MTFKMPEPDHSLDCGTLPFFTAEQVRMAYDQAAEDAIAQVEAFANELDAQNRPSGAVVRALIGRMTAAMHPNGGTTR